MQERNMPAYYIDCCPNCAHPNLDPRSILVGVMGKTAGNLNYHEIITLKCQQCGWLGEQGYLPEKKQA